VALFYPINHKPDTIQQGFKPIMRYHEVTAQWTCTHVDGTASGNGSTAVEAYHDMWDLWFALKSNQKDNHV
jgi:hypothetical protein